MNSTTAGRLLLASIVSFRFWQFKNSDINQSYGVIIFEMRDLNVMTHDLFGNELGKIPPNAMWLVSLCAGHPISDPW
jgi:hypothetical protein